MKYLYFLVLFTSCLALQAQDLSIENKSLTQQADDLISNFQFDRAIRLLNSASDSASINVLQRKAYCYARLGNLADAIAQYENILQVDSLHRNTLHQIGQLYSRTGQYISAKSCYEKLIAFDSTNSYYYKQYAIVAENANDFATAIPYYTRTLQLNQKDIEAYVGLGNILLEFEDYASADSILTQGVQFTNSAQLRLMLAKALLGNSKYNQVIEQVNQLLQNADTTLIHARLLGVSYFQTDKFKEVIQCMNYLERNEIKQDWVYYYLGASYQQLNDSQKAILYIEKAIEAGISDNISVYYTQLAANYEQIKDFKNAIRYYKAAYESTKSDILLYHLARNYDEYYKDKAQALAYYKRYLKSDDTIKVAKEFSRQRVEQITDNQ
jgi:tetratricopeptide (TPR) repeat protein